MRDTMMFIFSAGRWLHKHFPSPHPWCRQPKKQPGRSGTETPQAVDSVPGSIAMMNFMVALLSAQTSLLEQLI
jgi:hypothetical protein